MNANPTSTTGFYERIFDVTCAALLIVLFSPLLIAVTIAVKATSKGSIIHWSRRVGQYNCIFQMPKFRTMKTDTPQIATHLLLDPAKYLTPIGGFLRKTSLDELAAAVQRVGGATSAS